MLQNISSNTSRTGCSLLGFPLFLLLMFPGTVFTFINSIIMFCLSSTQASRTVTFWVLFSKIQGSSMEQKWFMSSPFEFECSSLRLSWVRVQRLLFQYFLVWNLHYIILLLVRLTIFGAIDECNILHSMIKYNLH